MSLVRKGLYNAEKINHKDLIADGYNRLGYAFEIRSANDSALVYYQKGLKINQIVNNKLGTSYALESIAGILNKQKRYNDALRYLRQSLALRVGLKDKFAQSISLINLGETYRSLKNTDSAIFYGKAASAMAQEVQFLDLAGYSNTFLSDIYKDQKDFKNALQYKERGVALKDSAFNIEKAKQIAELDRKYQTEKRIQQINILNQQATIDAMTVRQRNLMLVALIVLILVSGIVLYNIFAKRKLKAKAELQAEIIKQQDIAAKAVLDAEERERRRIAGDLHDGVGQMLSVALLNLNGVFSKIDLSETERAQADKTLGLLNESYDEMRSISHQMMPNALIKSGLATAVKEFLNKINKDRIKVSLQTVGLNKRLEDQLETVIYRVIQESVNNVIKHAEATSLDIQIVRDEEGLDVTIEDNGKGFDKDKLKKSDGIGMANIFTRIAFLKGTVEIDSAPGRGTLIAIHIPAN
jgi:signal transduction histidine kinase